MQHSLQMQTTLKILKKKKSDLKVNIQDTVINFRVLAGLNLVQPILSFTLCRERGVNNPIKGNTIHSSAPHISSMKMPPKC